MSATEVPSNCTIRELLTVAEPILTGGDKHMKGLAAKAGMSTEELAAKLSEFLPKAIADALRQGFLELALTARGSAIG